MNLLMIGAASAITYFSRFLPLVFGGEPGLLLARYLRLVPVAVFMALIVPGLGAPDGQVTLAPELAAGALGLAVVLLTRNIFLTLGAGYVLFLVLDNFGL